MHVLRDAESIDAEMRSCLDPCTRQLIADRAEFVRNEVDASEGEYVSGYGEPDGRGISSQRVAAKLTCLALLCLLVGCSVAPPQRSSGCIPGDPGGSPACQQEAYLRR
jgi:hypothetical protein